MANAAIVYENLADAATLSASSQILLAPVTNLQNEHVARKWRSRTSSAYVIVDLGAATSIDTVAIIGLTSSTVRLRISTSDSTGVAGDLYDSTAEASDQDFKQAIYVLGSSVSGRYLRFDLTHSSLEYVEAGRVVIGVRTAFTYNFGYDWSRSYVDPSVITKTRGGQTQIRPENTYQVLSITFPWLSVAEDAGFIDTISRVNAQKTDVLWLLDPESSDLPRNTIWGLMTEAAPITQPYFQIFSKTVSIEERL